VRKGEKELGLVVTYWYTALEHLETNVRPLAYWFQVDTAIDKGLCQVTTSGAESIRPDGDGTRNLVCIEKLNSLVM
jgi:hypothetical protein